MCATKSRFGTISHTHPLLVAHRRRNMSDEDMQVSAVGDGSSSGDEHQHVTTSRSALATSPPATMVPFSRTGASSAPSSARGRAPSAAGLEDPLWSLTGVRDPPRRPLPLRPRSFGFQATPTACGLACRPASRLATARSELGKPQQVTNSGRHRGERSGITRLRHAIWIGLGNRVVEQHMGLAKYFHNARATTKLGAN